jgi:hypothetical protein
MMGYLMWAIAGTAGGVGAVAETGFGDHRFAAIALAVAIGALLAACVWRVYQFRPERDSRSGD